MTPDGRGDSAPPAPRCLPCQGHWGRRTSGRACKGGGGNFGVVTAFEFSLHPVGPLILGGLLAWPADRAFEIARRYRDLAADAPTQLGSAWWC